MSAQRSIVIGGGAFAGLALALAFREGLGADVRVVVADPALRMPPSRDPRATAIVAAARALGMRRRGDPRGPAFVAACRRLFETLGVWGEVADTAQPILDMV